MANSLREASDSLTTKITEFRLIIRHPSNKDKILILVEGNTDIKFFRKIFNSTYAIVKELNGKDKVNNALGSLLTEYTNVIGIRDSDFDKLESSPSVNNLFLTDYHDFEIQMIESEAFQSIIDEHACESCYEELNSNIRNTLYNIGLTIGYLRWFNEREYRSTSSHKLLFDGLKYQDFITLNECCLTLNIETFLEKLLEHSKTKNQDLELTVEDLSGKIDELKELSTDKLQVCCGHDLTELFSIAIKKKANRKNIESNLRVSYKFDYFKNTSLYENIKEWNTANNNSLNIFVS